ncbi:TonB-dependent receptor plug domain-containing protein [Bacteroides sp. UBA939]|uniref:TonB-dependent receptor plug domain-containing protein n=1 Tax=Bacteroides sp. UBA939 TaxID=1946092 RepID=UPI0025C22D55|nr:TonB-dependent receptor plug domain-containing protein [Bacteroides sp. UBA939]
MKKDDPCRRIRLRFCLGCLICCLCINLQAQQAEDSITGKVHAIPEVAVKGRRTPQRISVAAPIQVFGKEELDSHGFQNIADAVRRFAGTNVRDYGGIGGLKTVSVRSLGATHTAVVYDGVAVSNCQAGQIDIGSFSLDDIDMLSLSIGQDENLLQPARLFASAGVLSIYSKNLLEGTDKLYAFKGQVKGGSFGFINPSATWAQRITSRTTYNISGNYQRADGNYPFTLVNGMEVTQEKRQNSDIYAWHAEGNLYHTMRDSSLLQVKVYYYDSGRGLPGSVILYNNTPNERLWDKNFFVQTQYRKDFSRVWALLVQGKYNYAWNKYEDTDVKYKNELHPSDKQTDRNKQLEYYLTGTLQWQPANSFTASWANDLAINTLGSNLSDSPLPVRYSWLSALNLRYQWQGLTATGTLVHTFITEEVKKGDRPDNLHRLCPTLSLLYRPWEERSFFLRMMYKNTFRVPSFNDLYYLRIGNTGLRPEKAQEFNLGVTWSGSPFSFTNYVALTIDGYYNKVDDKIVALPTTYVWRMFNSGKVDITGADVTLRTAIPLNRRISLTLTGNYTYQKAIDLTSEGDKNYKNQIAYTPVHSGNASVSIETPRINLVYTVTGVSERYSLPQNIEANYIDGYVEHTLTASRTFNLSTCKLRLQAELINLTDEQYDIIKFYPMPGRSFRLTGSIYF